MLQPLYERIVIEPIEQTTSAGGIVLPQKINKEIARGKVVAVGQGRMLLQGGFCAPTVKEGDVVLYQLYSGINVEHAGKKLALLVESDILAIEK